MLRVIFIYVIIDDRTESEFCNLHGSSRNCIFCMFSFLVSHLHVNTQKAGFADVTHTSVSGPKIHCSITLM